MKITVLSENTSQNKTLHAEHGLSLYIETTYKKIVFDTGQGTLFAENADKLGIDLSQADFAVISHGHYDHGGGLHTFISRNSHAPIYISQYAFLPYYSGDRYIGLDPSLASHPQLVFTGNQTQLEDTIQLTTCFGMPSVSVPGNIGMKQKKNGKFVPDPFLHEQYLLIQEDGKRIVFGGCTHKGIINVIRWLHPDIYIGGFHLKSLNLQDNGTVELEKIAKFLQHSQTRYFTCHCTGEWSYAFLKQQMSDQLSAIHCGDRIEI